MRLVVVVRHNSRLVHGHGRRQLALREVGVGHDRQHRAVLAVGLAPDGEAEDLELRGGAVRRVVVGYCPGLVEDFLMGGELAGFCVNFLLRGR
jgi:hypothetical protein